MSVETEDAFQKELVELFVQEAQEWLQQIHVAANRLYALVVGLIQCAVPAQDVGNLPDEQPQVGRFDLDVLETKQRLTRVVVAPKDVLAELEPR